MPVVPLTLTISLLLVFTFVIFFLVEHARGRFSSAERDSLLPLADEAPRPVPPPPLAPRCGCHDGPQSACSGCRHHK